MMANRDASVAANQMLPTSRHVYHMRGGSSTSCSTQFPPRGARNVRCDVPRTIGSPGRPGATHIAVMNARLRVSASAREPRKPPAMVTVTTLRHHCFLLAAAAPSRSMGSTAPSPPTASMRHRARAPPRATDAVLLAQPADGMRSARGCRRPSPPSPTRRGAPPPPSTQRARTPTRETASGAPGPAGASVPRLVPPVKRATGRA
mmetsp:Transcript_24324/g.84511  ORF Transcript_24324/g.84511 Transcript_24324/m.84511 type:complete len:204 (-) Transcript_24324:147-758(-)